MDLAGRPKWFGKEKVVQSRSEHVSEGMILQRIVELNDKMLVWCRKFSGVHEGTLG